MSPEAGAGKAAGEPWPGDPQGDDAGLDQATVARLKQEEEEEEDAETRALRLELEALERILAQWINLAWEMVNMAKENPSLQKGLPILEQAVPVYQMMGFQVKSLKKGLCFTNSRPTVLKCVDAKGDIQAVAVYGEIGNNYKLNWLATRPGNINCAANENCSTSLRGAGTQMVLHLMQKMFDHNLGSIILYSADSSIKFYEKMGFEKFLPSQGDWEFGDQGTPMQLTAEKAKKIVEQGLCPFNQLKIQMLAS